MTDKPRRNNSSSGSLRRNSSGGRLDPNNSGGLDPRRMAPLRQGSLAPFFVPPRSPGPQGEMSLLGLLAVGCAGAAFSAITTASLFIAWVQRMAPPTLYYLPTAANRALVMAMPLLFRSYVPNLLSWNAHAAGFFGYVKLPGKKPHSIERLTLPDGGTVCLSWNSTPVDGRPIIVLLPGINNEASMPYVRHLMALLSREEGLGHVAALDWRGLGHAGPLTSTSGTPRPYCAACSGDVSAVLLHLHTKLPSSPLYAVGWSLGAGLLLAHLGETGDACLLKAAMAVSPSLDMHANYQHMEKALHTHLYLPVIMAPLVAYLFKHRHALASGPNPLSFWRDVLPVVRQRHGLDSLFARLWQLPGGVAEYHRRGSAVHVLHRIKRTTLVVHAADDPICPVAAMPLDAMARNPHLITAITRHGGHMGYTAGLSPLAHTWTDRLLVHYLRALSGMDAMQDAEGLGASQSAAAVAPGRGPQATMTSTDAAGAASPVPAMHVRVQSKL